MIILNKRNSCRKNKKCRRGSRGTKNQLLIDKTGLKDYKKRHTNLSMAWIDYKKAYDFVPDSWIKKCMELFEIGRNIFGKEYGAMEVITDAKW